MQELWPFTVYSDSMPVFFSNRYRIEEKEEKKVFVLMDQVLMRLQPLLESFRAVLLTHTQALWSLERPLKIQ